MHGGQQLVGIIAPSAGRALAAPIVLVAELSQSLISGPPVGDDRRARLDVIHHERVQGLGRGIGQWRHAAPPQSSRLMNLNCDTGQHLLAPSAATGQPRLGAADVGLVHLYRPAQQIPTGTYQHRPQAVQHGPGSLVGADLQYSLQAQRRDPVFTGGEQPGGGLYNSAAIKYGNAADSYFIFPSAYHHTSDTLDIHLATSRDGIHFDRWTEPFVRLGASGQFDSKGMYMGAGLIAAGDEIYLYYNGTGGRHDIDVDVERVAEQKSGIGRLPLRRDGFASQDAGPDESWLTTVPFVLEGERLQVNMDASSRGWLKVEMLDATGHALWGFEESVADRLMFNDLAQTATWKGSPDLSALRGRSVRLRFVGQSARLYSFRFEGD